MPIDGSTGMSPAAPVATDTTSHGIERRSSDIVPAAERHGTPVSQFTLWCGANLQITAIVDGALAVVLGGVDPIWAILALLIGNILGGIVMALHSAQGPRLGLPQMISSRAQFGVLGAILPLVLVVVMYLGRVMERGPSKLVYAAPRHPYTKALLATAPVPDPTRVRTHVPLKGDIPSPIAPPSGCVFRTRCPEAIAACAETIPPVTAIGDGHHVACIRHDGRA